MNFEIAQFVLNSGYGSEIENENFSANKRDFHRPDTRVVDSFDG